MSILYDPDEWETVIETGFYGNGMGWGTCGQRRRPPEDVARIRAEKQKAHEEAVLAEADAIRARRAALTS